MSDDHERRLRALEEQRKTSTDRHDTVKVELASVKATLAEMVQSQEESREERRKAHDLMLQMNERQNETLERQNESMEEMHADTRLVRDFVIEQKAAAAEREKAAEKVAKELEERRARWGFAFKVIAGIGGVLALLRGLWEMFKNTKPPLP